jgi:hypothetical protein
VLRETPYSHLCHNRTLLHVMILHCSARGRGCSGLLRLIPSLSLRGVRPFAALGMLWPGGPWVGAAFGSSASWWIGEDLSPRTLLVARHFTITYYHLLLSYIVFPSFIVSPSLPSRAPSGLVEIENQHTLWSSLFLSDRERLQNASGLLQSFLCRSFSQT